jgi:uncharacterized protein (TIGR01777 family)
MKVAIAGGSGFVGKALTALLVREGHEVYILTRNKDKLAMENVIPIEWLGEHSKPEDELQGVEAIINLAGTSLNSGRWTKRRKQEILSSRIQATNEIYRIIEKLDQKLSVLINASAIGFYEPSEELTYTEDWGQAGDGFLAETVVQWEQRARKIMDFGVRVVFARFGLILGDKEGAFPKLVLPYKLLMGGNLGSGRQWYSWIHIEDVTNAILFCIRNNQIKGPVNFTAPHPMRMEDFGKTIGHALHRPHWTVIPSILFKTALGEMSTLILDGQKVMPEKLIGAGYLFIYPDLNSALNQLLK